LLSTDPMRRALLLVALAAGCGDDWTAAGPDAGAGDAAAVGQGSAASGTLVINEVSPRPADGADWFEILNRSDEPVDLCGVLATDGVDRLDHYHPLGGAAPPDPCEPRLLGPGQYLVVLADDGEGDGPDHAPFELSVAGEIHILTWTGRSVDGLLYLHGGAGGRSLARAPDGEGLFYPAPPTPGAPNPPEIAP